MHNSGHGETEPQAGPAGGDARAEAIQLQKQGTWRPPFERRIFLFRFGDTGEKQPGHQFTLPIAGRWANSRVGNHAAARPSATDELLRRRAARFPARSARCDDLYIDAAARIGHPRGTNGTDGKGHGSNWTPCQFGAGRQHRRFMRLHSDAVMRRKSAKVEKDIPQMPLGREPQPR